MDCRCSAIHLDGYHDLPADPMLPLIQWTILRKDQADRGWKKNDSLAIGVVALWSENLFDFFQPHAGLDAIGVFLGNEIRR